MRESSGSQWRPPKSPWVVLGCLASLLIAQGVDVAYVARQLSHANISTTLNVYAHLFDHARNAENVKQRFEEQFGHILATVEKSHVQPLLT
jgi:site-specific recombinase XerD